MKKAILAQTHQFNNPNSRPAEKINRNEELYKDYKNGMELFQLGFKYEITSTRIYQIINKMKAKEANRG